MRFETRAIHDGQEPDALTGAVNVPIYQTSTYRQDAIGKHKGYEYSRTGNPTRAALEKALASIEEGRFGLAFASGVAATIAFFSILKTGDHIVAGDDMYGGTYRLLERIVSKWGVTTTYADVDDPRSFKKALQKNTRAIWIETPTNPLLKIVDIKRIASFARGKRIVVAVDNTFASPYFQKPLLLGADVVVHSTTKYIAGHSDIVGGAVITNNDAIYKQIKFYQNAAGAVPGPLDAWLTLRGIKTLALRMREHEKNAQYLAQYLAAHKKIAKVYYPGFGGMISIELKGGVSAIEKFVSKLKLFTLAESLGGVESLICYPAKMTHASIPEEERLRRGITNSLVRLSVGIENRIDLKNDIANALK